MEEFFRQGDCERSLNLPISFLCDRHTIQIPAAQRGENCSLVYCVVTRMSVTLHVHTTQCIRDTLKYVHKDACLMRTVPTVPVRYKCVQNYIPLK